MKTIDWSINYTTFAKALLQLLDLQRDVKVYTASIDINPHGHLDGGLLIWLVAHATPEQIALAAHQAQPSEQ